MFEDTNPRPLRLDGLATSPGAGHPLGLSGADDDMHQSPVSRGAFLDPCSSPPTISHCMTFKILENLLTLSSWHLHNLKALFVDSFCTWIALFLHFFVLFWRTFGQFFCCLFVSIFYVGSPHLYTFVRFLWNFHAIFVNLYFDVLLCLFRFFNVLYVLLHTVI